MTQDEFKKIISLAIDGEIEAFTFYQSVADKAKDKKLKDLFNDLAKDEAQHRVMLEEYLTKTPGSLHFAESKDYKVVDDLPVPSLTPDLKPLDGLIIAIRKELGAMQMYTRLAQASTDAGQKKTFLELASMERGHKSRLEDIYTNMAFPEVW
ncbi:MAG: putative trifunctional 2-polyprenylphenol hydroxylase/glutamate synthase subunit beta/ferritin domain-containing protein [Syntrophorhabdus sp. PtaU1.Bin153]|nr:MAG: putative trifunctional 2-polyprenylphenol hydroxylase/glutamate synthase subunit beta/ferritin domain-containing protein [Syntrophorhabdus sp. PtaU1.Bin153]